MTINTKITLSNFRRDAFIRAVMDDVPKIDYKEKIREKVQAYFADKLPPAVRAIWNDLETRCYVKLGSAYVNFTTIYAPSHDSSLVITPDLAAELNDLIADNGRQDETLSALRAGLKSVVYGCRTYKALYEALPEFEKYFPKEQAKVEYPIVVANVVTEFMRAGWPKGA